MRAFLANTNASLPVEQPNDILLRLLRAQQRRVCHAACPEEWATAEGCPADGRPDASARPAPDSTIAAAEPHPAPPDRVQPPPDAAPTIASGEALAVARSTADAEAPAESPAESGLATPPEPLAHPHTRRGKSAKPPKLVRQLIRNVQRSLAPLGIR